MPFYVQFTINNVPSAIVVQRHQLLQTYQIRKEISVNRIRAKVQVGHRAFAPGRGPYQLYRLYIPRCSL
jgi:hypothetical protein